MEFEKLTAENFPEVIQLWEASVRFSHDFLKEEDISLMKPMLINTYLQSLNLVGLYKGGLIGFYGTRSSKLEMLYVLPNYIGQGYGKALLQHARKFEKIDAVEVNEQNRSALAFYEHQGFRIVNKIEKDHWGLGYPLVHMVFD
ncbi:GNAT family N-acetyltransferase [Litoribacter alkaliphilus]|uniref:GNAT family N-acetyltransferase n=1 Tax=Litoribacter ruber TaxID=702568 RepID=A0AAP2CF13_9BACT|nr:GNAT family N-acetyltransferase [Litoribacter alkaliphilus]MBS9523378.1 GNAT family N-acetyltransferase [Litoribacter alkaliphilus]